MPPLNEWKTRKLIIDKRLKSIVPSWKIIPYSPELDISSLTNHAVEEYPTPPPSLEI